MTNCQRKKRTHFYLYVTRNISYYIYSEGILTHKGQSKSKYNHRHGWRMSTTAVCDFLLKSAFADTVSVSNVSLT